MINPDCGDDDLGGIKGSHMGTCWIIKESKGGLLQFLGVLRPAREIFRTIIEKFWAFCQDCIAREDDDNLK